MRRQHGFTLFEIASVLVIIGLLLGGILKGQELVTGARVRNLISQQDAVRAAFFGFRDRFQAYPGDYALAAQSIPGVKGNGNGNGRVDADGSPAERLLVWDHLSHAGFITGTYAADATASFSTATNPVNPFSVYIDLVYDADYSGHGNTAERHNIKTGSEIPVEIVSQVDSKVDDGNAATGGFRGSEFQGGGGQGQCWNPSGEWRITSRFPSCGGASLL
jgi:prepilin-type N-terminal cleavage/methylation domain-containing protein